MRKNGRFSALLVVIAVALVTIITMLTVESVPAQTSPKQQFISERV